MLAVSRNVRLYGSGNQQPIPENQPFTAQDFPTKGSIARVWVGDIPAELREQLRWREAFNSAFIRKAFMSDARDFGDVIEEHLAHVAPLVFAGSEWYVSLCIDVQVEVPPSDTPDDQHMWADLRELINPAEALADRMLAPLDALTAYVAPIIGAAFFERELLSYTMYYVAPDGRLTRWPKLSGSGEAHFTKGDAFPVDDLNNRLQALTTVDWEAHAWLGRARSWYAAALIEKDGWRLFMAAWTGLEMLARMVGSRHVNDVKAKVVLGTVPPSIVEELTWSHQAPITAHFAAAAFEYAAHECEADLALFKRFRNARNDVTHGHSIDRATLPGTEARNLFEKYLELISASELSSS